MITYLQFEKLPLKKGPWSLQEDQKLIAYINRYGIWNWNEMPKAAGLLRSGKSCRLRWMNYLRPNLKHGNFSQEEDEIILTRHQTLGNRWSAIAAELPGRTDNEIKNHWHSHLKKRLNNNNNNNNFPVQETKLQQTTKVELKERKSAENVISYFTILNSSSSEDTKHNLFTSEYSSSNSNSFGEDQSVYSPEFYQNLDQYLQDQENQEMNYTDDQNCWNHSISPSGSSNNSSEYINSTLWPDNWEMADQLMWAEGSSFNSIDADLDLFEQSLLWLDNDQMKEENVGLTTLSDEQVTNLWEQQPFYLGDEDYVSMDYM